MNKKKILIISLITFIFILFIVLINISNKMNEKKIKSTITMNSKLTDVVYDENKLNI